MNEVLDGQVNLFDQDTWYGRTCPVPCPAMEETTSRQSSKKSSKSQNRKRPIFKCLNMGGLHGGGYRDVGGRWSVAYRVHDAQWWGVPQRRRRISVVADFGGSTAHEILFEPRSVSGDSAESGVQGERPAGTVEAGTSYAGKHIVAAFKSGQGAKAGSIGYEEEVSPTLSAVSSGTNLIPAILDMSHANDVIRECGEVVPSLQARMGTGGNQVPLTYQQVTGTLSPGAHAGSYNGQDAYNDMLVAHTLRARGNCTFREDSETFAINRDAVRRLTPLECTRLQGFPDGWVDIGEWTDEKGRVRKEADAPKYKALGNSIALPFWRWLLRRISEHLPKGATLGSLFDGIGGFPLCWAEICGAENCRWSSEIEQFPIAVVKRHFGDEDADVVGDIDKFLQKED